MSCSHRAWTESCALARAVGGGDDKLGKPEVQVLLGRERLLGTAHSFTRLRWLAAATVLVLAFGPAASLAHAATPSAAGGAGAQLLAPGSGEQSSGGSGLVLALQRRLAEAGFAPGPVDGRYGPRTELAVMRFQAGHGLQVDGIVGPQTLPALTAPIAVLYPGAGSEPGGSGPVRVLQRRLAEAGFAPGPVDGRYGPLTIEAVERFQRADGLTVDGITGPHTLHALRAGRYRPAMTGRPRLAAVSQSPSLRHVHSVPRPGSVLASRARERSPALPLTAVLLGFAVLGLVTVSGSYAWAHARVRRARATVRLPQARAPQALSPLSAGLSGVHAKHDGSER